MFIKLIINFFNKKSLFPKKLLLTTLSSATLFIGLFIYNNYFFAFELIDRTYMHNGPGPINSPTDKYTANAFYEPYGGAAGGVNVWVEITYNDEKNKVKTIYYSDAKNNFFMKWIDEDTLYIQNNAPAYPNSDRSITLKVDKEIYHETGRACNSILMRDEYTTCYKN